MADADVRSDGTAERPVTTTSVTTTWKERVLASLPTTTGRAIRFYRVHGSFPRLREPRTFSEKVNWRILRDRRPEIAWTCDKLIMKDVAATCPDVRVPRTVWSGLGLRELLSVHLPDRWVLKPNHRSGLVHIGRGPLDERALRDLERATARWLEPWQSRHLGEWAYSQARPRFLVEEFIGPGDIPVDYKFFVFHGEPQLVQVDTQRFEGHRRSMFTTDWRLLPVRVLYPEAGPLPPPKDLPRMLDVARTLGRSFDFIRIDLYEAGDEVWFGEFTPYPGSGLEPITPHHFDEAWGRLWRHRVA